MQFPDRRQSQLHALAGHCVACETELATAKRARSAGIGCYNVAFVRRVSTAAWDVAESAPGSAPTKSREDLIALPAFVCAALNAHASRTSTRRIVEHIMRATGGIVHLQPPSRRRAEETRLTLDRQSRGALATRPPALLFVAWSAGQGSGYLMHVCGSFVPWKVSHVGQKFTSKSVNTMAGLPSTSAFSSRSSTPACLSSAQSLCQRLSK
jgi:hypothetical protein